MITLNAKATQNFFDRKAVRNALKPATRKALSQAGAFVRTSARSSMKSRGKKNARSQPGQPPRYTPGNGLLRKRLFFAFDRAKESVVVGPVGFRGSKVPELMEYGGNTRLRNHVMPLKQARATGQRRFYRYTGPAKYRPRPFMNPALERERANIPKQFRNSITGGD